MGIVEPQFTRVTSSTARWHDSFNKRDIRKAPKRDLKEVKERTESRDIGSECTASILDHSFFLIC
jgi:hypothetical protein